MPITLAQAQANTQNDVDFAVIDNLRRFSWLLDQIVFDDAVTPGTNGGTLTYSYTRLVTPAPADFRAINSEYASNQATRERKSVDLKPLGGKFTVDRVLADLGPAATNEVSFQLQQLLVSIRTRFQKEVVLGDLAVNANGFDGLSKALTGTVNEFNTGAVADWTTGTVNTTDKANDVLDQLDEFLSLIVPSQTGGGTGAPGDVPPGVKAILGNTKSITRARSLARRASIYSTSTDDLGRTVERYGDWVLVDIGDLPDGSAPIIPVETRTVGGVATNNLTDLYAVSFGLDALHGSSVAGHQLVRTWMPDFEHAGAVKDGEAEMGPVATCLKNTRSAAVFRNVQVAQ